jgi:ABC-type transporter MlaC component
MRAAAIVIVVLAATCTIAVRAQGAEPGAPVPRSTPPAKRAPAPKPEVVVLAPSDELRAHLQRVVTGLRQPPGTAGPRDNPGHAALLAMFDLQETARRIVDGDVAKDLTTAQQQQLRSVLADVMSRVVRRIADYLRLAQDESLERYASAPLSFREWMLSEREAIVDGALPGKGGRDIEMTAWMVRRGPRWLVYDLRMNDTTLVESYRAQCGAILRRSSYAMLLARLKDKRDGLDVTDAGTASIVRPTPTRRAPTVIARPTVSPAMSP